MKDDVIDFVKKQAYDDVEQGGNVFYKEIVVEKEVPKDDKSLKPNSMVVLDLISFFFINLLLLHLYIILNECLKRS